MSKVALPSSDHIAEWGRHTFSQYKGCIAYIVTKDDKGGSGIGTCFHVGEGVFVTARHVVDGRDITEIGFDDGVTSLNLIQDTENFEAGSHGLVTLKCGPLFHKDPTIDVACFTVYPFPKPFIPLGGHLDDWLGQYELVLHKTLVLGYPPIPCTDRPVLVASLGEINALADSMYLQTHKHPHFIISSMARGGFSGAPVLVAYNEANPNGGTAALGLVTQSLTKNGAPEELGYMAVLTVEPIYRLLLQHSLLPSAQQLDIDLIP